MKEILEVCLIVILLLISLSLFSERSGKVFKNVNFFVVRSGSMEPVIKSGSLLVSVRFDNYFPKDVVTFKSPATGEFVSHRIEEKDFEDGRNVYFTKGDANKEVDDWSVKEEEVIGKVLIVIPLLGRLVSFMQTLRGLVFLIYLPCAIIIFWEASCIIWNLKGNKRII
ncbi:signal peptidase I [candidate division WWE3 bacterium RIFCSPHIGHO2_01_FULL_40_23]|uniref:Signal peptidase I n=1 Tax=candidate division WWE3 bacterium RIFCSPLOWO2_01_FULL_41_18 TaxID=1802625 RepID=A0A1F4VDB3_UNCKA|nr:MAG: signal peptidase I [candidate division WWE3 bacterium RIFCSPHIGHO2_01_FULL_40_23]OGC55139.1 MAG: signal peptidase I [candidate division WWE3 bacterium RIFCSPLOWO2_01_FULL_41_18]